MASKDGRISRLARRGLDTEALATIYCESSTNGLILRSFLSKVTRIQTGCHTFSRMAGKCVPATRSYRLNINNNCLI